MKKLLIGSLALAVLLPYTSATADQWEQQKERQQMMMDGQPGMHSDDTMMRRHSRTGMDRDTRLEQGSRRSIEDLENMPPTAAGQEEGSMDEKRQYKKRSGHRGEVDGGY
ncbi:hypothetical protein [Marinobacter sediminum]|uniref:hypothetical protein n=1 Tax=Marinobacter sediminum TaxID=256323 RepID=UPI001939D91F|nr:hypothetical protein [Marinobacter sediminum]